MVLCETWHKQHGSWDDTLSIFNCMIHTETRLCPPLSSPRLSFHTEPKATLTSNPSSTVCPSGGASLAEVPGSSVEKMEPKSCEFMYAVNETLINLRIKYKFAQIKLHWKLHTTPTAIEMRVGVRVFETLTQQLYLPIQVISKGNHAMARAIRD